MVMAWTVSSAIQVTLYILEYLALGGALGYNDVPYEGYHQYADLYYGAFFNYTREVRGDAGLIMSRPVDCLLRQGVTCVSGTVA